MTFFRMRGRRRSFAIEPVVSTERTREKTKEGVKEKGLGLGGEGYHCRHTELTGIECPSELDSLAFGYCLCKFHYAHESSRPTSPILALPFAAVRTFHPTLVVVVIEFAKSIPYTHWLEFPVHGKPLSHLHKQVFQGRNW